MKVIRRISYKGFEAVLYSNGDVMWCGMFFPNGMGVNEGLSKALKSTTMTTGWMLAATAEKA